MVQQTSVGMLRVPRREFVLSCSAVCKQSKHSKQNNQTKQSSINHSIHKKSISQSHALNLTISQSLCIYNLTTSRPHRTCRKWSLR